MAALPREPVLIEHPGTTSAAHTTPEFGQTSLNCGYRGRQVRISLSFHVTSKRCARRSSDTCSVQLDAIPVAPLSRRQMKDRELVGAATADETSEGREGAGVSGFHHGKCLR
jgi:hypothetical protein